MKQIFNDSELVGKTIESYIIGDDEMWLKKDPIPQYNPEKEYEFDFDHTAKYKFIQVTFLPEIFSKGFPFYVFERSSDKQLAHFTKFSHIKIR